MASVTQQTIATGNTLGHVTRPARALVGWMQPAEAQLMLAQRMVQLAEQPAHVDRAAAAQQTVSSRAPMVGEPHVLDEPGAELQEHIGNLIAHSDYRSFATERWTVRIADLSRVIALQPMVFWDHARERTSSAVSGDMAVLARITIPIRSGPEPLPL